MAGETSTPSANGNCAGVPGTNSIWAYLFFFLWWRLSDGCWVAETTDLLFGEWFMSKLLLLNAYKNHKIQDIHGRHSNVYMEDIQFQYKVLAYAYSLGQIFLTLQWIGRSTFGQLVEKSLTSWIGPSARYDYLSLPKARHLRVYQYQGILFTRRGW